MAKQGKRVRKPNQPKTTPPRSQRKKNGTTAVVGDLRTPYKGPIGNGSQSKTRSKRRK